MNPFVSAAAAAFAAFGLGRLSRWPTPKRDEPSEQHVYSIDATPLGEPSRTPPEKPYRGDYSFTQQCDWFTGNIPSWSSALEPFKGRPNLRYLEVGVSEGRSTVWMIENVLTHPTSSATCIDPFMHWPGFLEKEGEVVDCFNANLEASGAAERVRAIQGFSQIELRKLPTDELFDIIYVDGRHEARSALEDLVLAWRLLAVGGVLIADDYLYFEDKPIAGRPMMGIDFFVEAFGDELEVVLRRYQVIVRKTATLNLIGANPYL